MKILCTLYIITVFLSEGAKTRYRPEPKHLLQKPYSAERIQQTNQLVKGNNSQQHYHEDDISKHAHHLVHCPSHRQQNPQTELAMTGSMSFETVENQPPRGKRDAQMPRRRRRRRGPARRMRRVSRLKDKRAQPVVVVEAERPMIQPSSPSPTKPSSSSPQQPQQPQQPQSPGPTSGSAPAPPPGATTNGDDLSKYPARNQQRGKDKDESNRSSSQLLVTVLLCLLIASLSGLLLMYLYCRSRKQSGLNSFFYPPDSARSRDNLTDLDRCTCCSGATYSGSPDTQCSSRPRASSKQERRPVVLPKEKPSKKVSKSTPKRPKEKKPQPQIQQQQQFSSSSPSPTPSKKQPPCFSEAELREIQSKIAYILRNQCAGCKCCKCNALHTASKQKPSRFKLFRKKKATGSLLCDDLRCGENKIKCIGRLYGAADPYDSRTSNTDVCRANPWDKSAPKAKPRATELRIRE